MIKTDLIMRFSSLILIIGVLKETSAFLRPYTQAKVTLHRSSSSANYVEAESPSESPVSTRQELKEALIESISGKTSEDQVLACPVSLQPLQTKVRLAGPFGEIKTLVCANSGSTYPVNSVFADLVPRDEQKAPWEIPLRTTLFRSPLTSFLYERGWRQNFALSGFPGIEKEFEELEEFLDAIEEKRVILDMSCGSGLMTRRIVKSQKWNRVIAADFSESMLRETKIRFSREGIAQEPDLIRADASRLPFQTESIDAIHAGAALHCWPRLEESVREMYRVLRPGGRFYASTFEVNERLRSNTFKFFKLEELKDLLVACGFPSDQVDIRREGTACLIAKVVK